MSTTVSHLKRVLCLACIRDLTQLGRERHETMVLITEYNDFTWESNQVATFPLFLTSCVHTASSKVKYKRTIFPNKKREKGMFLVASGSYCHYYRQTCHTTGPRVSKNAKPETCVYYSPPSTRQIVFFKVTFSPQQQKQIHKYIFLWNLANRK